jgi:hypothetical protein
MFKSAGCENVRLEERGHFAGPAGNVVNEKRSDVSFTDPATGERTVCDATIHHSATHVNGAGPRRVAWECHVAIHQKNAKYLPFLGLDRTFVVLAHNSFGRFSAPAARILRQAARQAHATAHVSPSLFLQGWSARISFALVKAVASTTLQRLHSLQTVHAAANGVGLPHDAAVHLALDGGVGAVDGGGALVGVGGGG